MISVCHENLEKLSRITIERLKKLLSKGQYEEALEGARYIPLRMQLYRFMNSLFRSYRAATKGRQDRGVDLHQRASQIVVERLTPLFSMGGTERVLMGDLNNLVQKKLAEEAFQVICEMKRRAPSLCAALITSPYAIFGCSFRPTPTNIRRFSLTNRLRLFASI
jgi:hypothetical protein